MSSQEFEDYLISIGGLVNGWKPISDTKPIISRGICECSDGWLQIIHDLIEELIAAGWNKEILQIKEKFAGLRFYTNATTQEQDEIIRKYVEKALRICELCGSTENVKIRGSNWVQSLCDQHEKPVNAFFEKTT
jgi:hypothetical protein